MAELEKTEKITIVTVTLGVTQKEGTLSNE